MGESRRRKTFAAASGIPFEAKNKRKEAFEVPARELLDLFDLPIVAPAYWPQPMAKIVDDLCRKLHASGWLNPIIHKNADGQPVIISTRGHGPEMEVVIADRITPETARYRILSAQSS